MTYSLETAFSAAKTLLAASEIPFIIGPVGAGKTSRVRTELAPFWAEHRGKPETKIWWVPCNSISPEDIQIYALNDGELVPHVTSALPKNGGNDGFAHIIVFDDYTKSSKAIDGIVSSLTLERKLFGTDYVLSDDVAIVFTGNRLKDRAGDRKLPTHLVNRLSTIEVEFTEEDYRTWKTHAHKTGVDPRVVAWSNYFTPLLKEQEPDELGRQITPRSVTKLGRVMANTPAELVLPVAESFIGKGGALELNSFISVCSDLPNISDIIRAPLDTKPVSRLDILHIVVTSLINKCGSNSDVAASLQYIERCNAGRELVNLFVRDLLGAKPELLQTEAITRWKTDNADINI